MVRWELHNEPTVCCGVCVTEASHPRACVRSLVQRTARLKGVGIFKGQGSLEGLGCWDAGV